MFTGIFAAPLTPVDDGGRVDLAATDRLIDFLVASGIDGVCIGGATGEFPRFDVHERQAHIERTAARLPSDKTLFVAIGAGSVRQVLELGHCAVASGARGLLLPMPFFFRYDQHDLEAFCQHVSRTLGVPCLLYDLPAFTNPLETATILSLLRSEAHIVGIKDSSGDVARLTTLAEARAGAPWSLLVGQDHLIGQGLDAGWNGAISGLASFCPEVIVALYRAVRGGTVAERVRLETSMGQLINELAEFPTPWGIRLGLQARGLSAGVPFPWPASAARRRSIERFDAWLTEWCAREGLRCVW